MLTFLAKKNKMKKVLGTAYLLLHVSIFLFLSLPDGSRWAQYGHLIELEELATQAVLEVLVQLTAVTHLRHVRRCLLVHFAFLSSYGVNNHIFTYHLISHQLAVCMKSLKNSW